MATQIVINDPTSQRHVPAPAVVIVSSDANNALKSGSDGNLFVEKPESSNLVSKQPGNYVRYGSDLGVYLDGNDVLSNGKTNLLHTSDRDGRVELTAEDLKEAGIGSGDVKKEDFDDLKSDVNGVKSDVNNLKTDVNNLKTDVASLERSVNQNKSDITGLRRDVDKNSSDIADLKRDVQNVTVVSSDRKNVIVAGSDKGAYLSADDIVDVVEEAGITKVDVKDLIHTGTDPLLSVQGDKLVSGLQVRYNEADGRLDILGVHGNSIAHTTIPTAVALLKQVTIEDNPASQPAGTYIHFVFALTDGTESHVYLNVNKLAQFYSAGEGIEIAGDGTISVNREFVEEVADEAIDEELKEGGSISDAIKEAVLEGVTVVSGNAGNVLTAGTDKGAYLGKSSITNAINDEIASGNVSLVSGDADNLLKKGNDGGVFLDKADVPAAGPSSDSGNALTEGSDGKLYFKPVTDYGELA